MDNAENLFKDLTEKIFADKIADKAIEMIDSDTMNKYATDLFQSLNWDDKKCRYWNSNSSDMQTLIYNKFKERVGIKLQEIVDEGLFDEEASSTARRIYEEALDAAERYMVEALANHMCCISTDFENAKMKINMIDFVNKVMYEHMNRNHVI